MLTLITSSFISIQIFPYGGLNFNYRNINLTLNTEKLKQRQLDKYLTLNVSKAKQRHLEMSPTEEEKLYYQN